MVVFYSNYILFPNYKKEENKYIMNASLAWLLKTWHEWWIHQKKTMKGRNHIWKERGLPKSSGHGSVSSFGTNKVALCLIESSQFILFLMTSATLCAFYLSLTWDKDLFFYSSPLSYNTFKFHLIFLSNFC